MNVSEAYNFTIKETDMLAQAAGLNKRAFLLDEILSMNQESTIQSSISNTPLKSGKPAGIYIGFAAYQTGEEPIIHMRRWMQCAHGKNLRRYLRARNAFGKILAAPPSAIKSQAG